MGLLGTNMLAEAAKSDGTLLVGLELDFPSETWRMATGPISSDSLGHFEPRIKNISPPIRSANTRRGGIVSPEMSVTFDDTDGRFAKLLGRKERIANAPARAMILSPNVAPVTYYTGRLHDIPPTPGKEYTLNLRPPDVALDQNFCKKVIHPSLWPYADPDVRGKIAPIVLGIHDSSGMGSRGGALPTLAVKSDATPFWRLGSWGRLMRVPHVFDGDTLVDPSDYTIEYPIVGGEPYTIVSFPDEPSGEVRIDAWGLDSVGDLTGALIDKPTDIAKWIFVNLVDRENTSGLAFADASAPIDAASFDAVRNSPEMLRGANGQPYRGQFYSDAEMTFKTYLEAWCPSNRCNILWTIDGKLQAKLLSNLGRGTYAVEHVWREPADVSEISIEYPAQDWIRRIFVRYGRQVGGDYIDSLELADPLIQVESSDTIELAAGPGLK